MLEIELNIVTPDVGSHSNNGSSVKLTDEMASRHAIEVRHDDVHQNEIVFGTVLNFVDRFQSIEL